MSLAEQVAVDEEGGILGLGEWRKGFVSYAYSQPEIEGGEKLWAFLGQGEGACDGFSPRSAEGEGEIGAASHQGGFADREELFINADGDETCVVDGVWHCENGDAQKVFCVIAMMLRSDTDIVIMFEYTDQLAHTPRGIGWQ